MMTNPKKLPLIVIVGPTAVGKTQISIEVAKRWAGEIISADSCLLYRGMDIGTAKPSLKERDGVPHYLIDVAEPDEIWSLALFQQKAYQRINEIHTREKLPFLVGGTGQYIRAIIEGWHIPPQAPDYLLRDQLNLWAERVGKQGLHDVLHQLDPDAAEKIDYRNLRRTVRALEVIFRTGQKFSDQRRKQESPFDSIVIGLQRPREELYRRVDQRINNMIEQGLVEEVQQLLAKGYSPELPTMSAIGYGEIISYLQGQISLEEAIALIRKNTRKFVRRQANWFKPSDPRITWFEVTEDTSNQIDQWLRSKLDE